jgi:hypothetical protein
MAMLGPVLMRALKCSHDMPRDYFSFCLKDRRERMLWKLASCGNYGNFNQVHRILIRWPQLKVGCASSEIIGLESWWEGLSE